MKLAKCITNLIHLVLKFIHTFSTPNTSLLLTARD